MDNLLDFLDKIEDILESSKSIPFSSKISVEKERIFEVISDIRLHLPAEIRQAQRIIEDHDKIIADARVKAEKIKKEAEDTAKAMVNEHEIFRRAADQASETVEEGKKDAREMRQNAVAYADEILEDTENQVRQTMENVEEQFRLVSDYLTQIIDVLYENRQSLRGR